MPTAKPTAASKKPQVEDHCSLEPDPPAINNSFIILLNRARLDSPTDASSSHKRSISWQLLYYLPLAATIPATNN